MSRLSKLSPETIKALLSVETDANLMCLLTFYDPNTNAVLARVSDSVQYDAEGVGYRISETESDIIYGVSSRGNNYTFLPLQITLPSEQEGAVPRFTVTIHDVTRIMMPIVRSFNSAPSVLLELVLSKTPDIIEASFPGFKMSSISYNQSTITAELTIESLALEPFPQHSFTPAYFPGLF